MRGAGHVSSVQQSISEDIGNFGFGAYCRHYVVTGVYSQFLLKSYEMRFMRFLFFFIIIIEYITSRDAFCVSEFRTTSLAV